MRFVFLYVDRYSFAEGWLYPESLTPYCMLRYILVGNATFEIDGKKIDVEADEVIYIPEGSRLKCYSTDAQFSFISIRFINTLRLNGNDFLSEFFSLPLVTKKVPACVKEYFQAVYNGATSKKVNKLFTIRGYLELIIAELVEMANDDGTEEEPRDIDTDPMSISDIFDREYKSKERQAGIKNDPRIQVAVNYIIGHPTERFDEEYLCRLAGLSPSSLRRLFRIQTGKAPTEFARELKMMAAARQLLMSDAPIATISYELGFEDPNYFARVFKKVFGVSPNNYRASARTVGNIIEPEESAIKP